jgi:hypothetical protein
MLAIGPMSGMKASTMKMTNSTRIIPIHVPAAARKIDQADAIQLQPLPVGTVRPLGTKLPCATTVASATGALGAA